MKIVSWASFSPRLSGRAVATMAAAAPAPVWMSLLKGGLAKQEGGPHCQLATAAIGGGASCRTLGFQGFYKDKGALKFTTDRRSQKIPEIAADSAGEVCFYLEATREQFRVKGRLQVVGVGEVNDVLAKARRHEWSQIGPALLDYYETSTSLMPGLEIPVVGEKDPGRSGGSGSENGDEVGTGAARWEGSTRQRGEGGSPEAPISDDFCLVLLWPHYVDHLRLRDTQTRSVHRIEGERDGGGALLSGAGGAGPEGGGVPEVPVTWVTMAVNP